MLNIVLIAYNIKLVMKVLKNPKIQKPKTNNNNKKKKQLYKFDYINLFSKYVSTDHLFARQSTSTDHSCSLLCWHWSPALS